MNPIWKPRTDKMGARSLGTPTVISTRLAASGPAGLAVLLLVGSIALGSTAGGLAPIGLNAPGEGIQMENKQAPDKHDVAQAEADEAAKDETKPETSTDEAAKDWADVDGSYDDKAVEFAHNEKPDPTLTPDPTPKPEEPKPVATPKPVVAQQPAPEKTPKPTPKPAPVTTALSLAVGPHPEVAGKLVLQWSVYNGDLFKYYKVVRTTDGDPTWPAGGADELIGAFDGREQTWAKDWPPCGTTVWYRVFAVHKTDAGYQVLAASNAASGATECPPPPPPTESIGLEGSFAEGHVNLAWGFCASEHFNAYKVVRSLTNPEPTYPENDGTELIAAIGDQAQTWFSDGNVASGQTWYYRVFARADAGGGHYIACQSPVLAVTVP